eukprot:TRINITY_DN33491_c0_g1_i1.p1 TRINITY_DN33491_c0_g1~~TRINITY_DN33491_c0_g1_i1.p1  ORF type:complete len:180 (-),score=20.96 TRINITY_DN33491_c0_g1_i1:70-609(-)
MPVLDVVVSPEWLDQKTLCELPVLHRAACLGDERTVWDMLRYGTSVHQMASFQITITAQGRRASFLDSYAVVHVTDLTPLHCALLRRFDNVVSLLLHAGARMTDALRFDAQGFGPIWEPQSGRLTGTQMAEIFGSVFAGHFDENPCTTCCTAYPQYGYGQQVHHRLAPPHNLDAGCSIQ